jgi:hypothetical protein
MATKSMSREAPTLGKSDGAWRRLAARAATRLERGGFANREHAAKSGDATYRYGRGWTRP